MAVRRRLSLPSRVLSVSLSSAVCVLLQEQGIWRDRESPSMTDVCKISTNVEINGNTEILLTIGVPWQYILYLYLFHFKIKLF